jgi:phosphoglycolate phosphatase-like HAD superfamily hydrolase
VTDTGIAIEACARSGRRRPSLAELEQVCARFTSMLAAAIRKDPHACTAVPGAAEFIARLRSLPDIVVAFATGGWKAPARLKLTAAGIAHDGIAFASSDDDMRREEILRLACRRAAQTSTVDGFDSHVYVGDGVWDAKCARALGYGFVGRASGSAAEQLVRLGAVSALEDFTDPEAALARLTDARHGSRVGPVPDS